MTHVILLAFKLLSALLCYAKSLLRKSAPTQKLSPPRLLRKKLSPLRLPLYARGGWWPAESLEKKLRPQRSGKESGKSRGSHPFPFGPEDLQSAVQYVIYMLNTFWRDSTPVFPQKPFPHKKRLEVLVALSSGRTCSHLLCVLCFPSRS